MSLRERLTAPGPKRILSLDGGGIRGALTLGFLQRIEAILRDRHGRPDLKLADYFDLIGGTSTGAIIAGALAIGEDVESVLEKYLELGGEVFGKKKWKKHVALFDAEPLEQELLEMFVDITLGDSERIHTGLCVITKRADTRSTWPLINHPDGKYFGKNAGMLLREVVRASTAAPVYFVPEELEVGDGERAAFVDGGVSLANNPSLQLFLIATLQGFPFHWETGPDKLMLVSVGTGVWSRRDLVEEVMNEKIWNWAGEVPSMLMEDASWGNQLLLQYLSRSATPWTIDREVGNLSEDLLTEKPALTYLRYNVRLERNDLHLLGLRELAERAVELREMSAAGNRFDLARIGQAAAERQVKEVHLPRAFDLAPVE